jgi:hypothetical protein
MLAPITAEENLNPVTSGDDVIYNLEFSDDTDSPIDISGWTVYLTVKEDHDDSDEDALVNTDVTNHDAPTEGKTSVKITQSETEDLHGAKVYDIQIQKSNGDIRTVLSGSVYFEKDVTERT